MSEHIRIMTSSSVTINRLASILDQNGIPTLIRDNNESGRLAGFGTSPGDVDLLVDKPDFERASEIIKAYKGDAS